MTAQQETTGDGRALVPPPQTAQRRILVVEDEYDIATLVALHLRDAGYAVEIASDGAQGLAAALSGGFDLLVLDLLLPVIDGLELCRKLRGERLQVPILMVTSRDTELDRILGLEIGADDYLTKPFSVRELVARVRAIFRRIEAFEVLPQPREDLDTVAIGEIVIEPRSREVSVRGGAIQLTAREFDLLLFFCRNPGRVFRRLELLKDVWGYAYEGYEHTVNSHINRLRAKIEADPNEPSLILTVWGVGYKFDPSRTES